MPKTQTLPESVIQHLNKNMMFNKFGLVNIAALKATTDCNIPDNQLKRLIQKRFGKEMQTGEVEFTKNK